VNKENEVNRKMEAKQHNAIPTPAKGEASQAARGGQVARYNYVSPLPTKDALSPNATLGTDDEERGE
jgi:hypothetical protein